MRKKIGFDIGSCLGERISDFEDFDEIYAFEPSPCVFNFLFEKCKNDSRIKCFQIGVSDEDGFKKFNCHDHYGYSSFLEIDQEGELSKEWHQVDPGFDNVILVAEIETKRMDTFMKENCIDHIDFIKVDTQGNDLNVVKSLGEMINKVDIIEMEVQMKSFYKESCSREEIFEFMQKNNFDLVSEEENGFSQWENERRLVFKRCSK